MSFIRMPAKPKRSKYNVDHSDEGKRKRTYNGVLYASQAEARRAYQLDLQCKDGCFCWWISQPKFRLGCPENVYIADFLVMEITGYVHVEDIKGQETAKFRHDVNLWKKYGPCDLWIIRRTCDQIIKPESPPCQTTKSSKPD